MQQQQNPNKRWMTKKACSREEEDKEEILTSRVSLEELAYK
jgi:hypothetical protein